VRPIPSDLTLGARVYPFHRLVGNRADKGVTAECAMSAPGHKQTLGARASEVRLAHRKRTLPGVTRVSAKGQ
jgi:hypothetical protein